MNAALVLSLATVSTLACASARSAAPVPPRVPDTFAVRLAEADRLASRGCYLCLKEAAAAYSALLADSADPVLARKALENHLMLALREIELRIPDSGARDAAVELQARVPISYSTYFAALDALAPPGPAEAGGVAASARAGRYALEQNREARATIASALEQEWPASAMKAYFYLVMALGAGQWNDLKPQIEAMLSTHPEDLSLR